MLRLPGMHFPRISVQRGNDSEFRKCLNRITRLKIHRAHCLVSMCWLAM